MTDPLREPWPYQRVEGVGGRMRFTVASDKPLPPIAPARVHSAGPNGVALSYSIVMLRDSERARLVNEIATEVVKRMREVASG